MKTVFFFAFILFSCSTNKMGKASYGKDGTIISGKVNTKCSPPTKRYTKSLDIKVKAGIDSLQFLPTDKLEVGIMQTVTRLSDYSSEGLDIDLILFRLCEISLNKGFTSEQTNAFFATAMDAWAKKNSSK